MMGTLVKVNDKSAFNYFSLSFDYIDFFKFYIDAAVGKLVRNLVLFSVFLNFFISYF